jgi:putative tricarboxylic transport membrane protein
VHRLAKTCTLPATSTAKAIKLTAEQLGNNARDVNQTESGKVVFMKRFRSYIGLAMVLTLLLAAGCSGANSAPAPAPTPSSAPSAAPVSPAAPAPAEFKIALPKGAVQLYCPFKAGGGTDLIARTLVDFINKKHGSNIVVVNQSDGGGAVCYNTVKNAKPDGRIALYSHSSFLGTYLSGTHDIDPGTAFDYVNASLIGGAYYLNVPANSPFKDLKEMIDYAQAHPKEVTLGVQAGSMSNYIIAEFASNANVDFKYVETGSGDADRVAGLLGNLFDVSLVNAAQTGSYIEAGELRSLCALTEKGDVVGVLNDVPECMDFGVKKGEVGTLCFVALPKGADENLKRSFGEAFHEALEDPGVQAALNKINMGMTVWYDYDSAHEAVIKDYELYSSLAEAFGLKAAGR